MAISSRQIGWGTESNLLWQILKQLNHLTNILFGLKEAATPKYKVYTALVSQSGGDDLQQIFGGDLIIGVTYQIFDDGAGLPNWDFTNVGAPNNDFETYFVATGTTPNSWGTGIGLLYNTGAPTVIVLENTIGNIWFTYNDPGIYSGGIYGCNSDGLFIEDKVFTIVTNLTNQIDAPTYFTTTFGYDNDSTVLLKTAIKDDYQNGLIAPNTPIEIRVYN